MLLEFPAELFDLILSFLDPPSFSLLLLVNKSLREHILKSPQLHSQLRSLPHLHHCRQLQCKSGGPEQLLQLFNKRAASNCLNGISVLCDAVTYKSNFTPQIRLGQLERFEGNHDPAELIAVPEAGTGRVHIYSLNHGFPLGRFIIDPVALHPALDNFEIALLKLHEQDGKRHISILYQYSALRDASLDAGFNRKSSLVTDAQSSRTQKMVLLTCSIAPSDGVNVISVRDLSIGRRYTPIAMEMSTIGQAIVVFKLDGELYRIKAYTYSKIYGMAFTLMQCILLTTPTDIDIIRSELS
jgi:hypothetical protein